jgi:cytosine/uracil/thiamine/allantoin permease
VGAGDAVAQEKGVRSSALVAWLAGTALGLACTASPLFTGPLALGVFASSSLGYFLGFFVSGAIYLMAQAFSLRRARWAGPARAGELVH